MIAIPPPDVCRSLQLCIHRGTREIGGTCVELESSGQRILLDLGLPLNAKRYGLDTAASRRRVGRG